MYVKVSGYDLHKYLLKLWIFFTFYFLKGQLSVPMFNFYLINLNIKAFVKSTSHSEGESLIYILSGRIIEGDEGDGGEGGERKW